MNGLPFEYTTRARQLAQASELERSQLSEERDNELENYLASLNNNATTTWTAVTFEGSWVDRGGSYQTVQYRKFGDMVQVRGAAKSGTNSSVIFYLPVGFRPPGSLSLGVYTTGTVLGAIDVSASTGAVYFGPSGGTGFVSCDFQFSVTA